MMNVNRLIRWSIPIACLLAMGLGSKQADASSLLSQAGVVQAVAPVTTGWYRRGWGYGGYGGWGYGGWGGYRGFGTYYYGRPALYFGAYRPAYYAPRYVSYGYASPYSGNYGYAPAYYGGYVSAYSPVVYSTPLYTTSYYAAQPAYVYPTSYYTAYGGYGYAYPTYASYGYATYSPYGACCGYW